MSADFVTLASMIAIVAHDGQVDKSGAPYIEHPRRIASNVYLDDIEQAAAWLHDVLEDTSHTELDLRMSDIPEEVIEIVKILTRRKDPQNGGETYSEFIDRIIVSRNVRAIRVKLADLNDNLRPLGNSVWAGKTSHAEMVEKRYKPAIERLTAALFSLEFDKTKHVDCDCMSCRPWTY